MKLITTFGNFDLLEYSGSLNICLPRAGPYTRWIEQTFNTNMRGIKDDASAINAFRINNKQYHGIAYLDEITFSNHHFENFILDKLPRNINTSQKFLFAWNVSKHADRI